MEKKPNQCISCTVESCEHHCNNEDYCSLGRVQITTHETNPTEIQCTDCGSFKKSIL